jgi:hypothetical protein
LDWITKIPFCKKLFEEPVMRLPLDKGVRGISEGLKRMDLS